MFSEFESFAKRMTALDEIKRGVLEAQLAMSLGDREQFIEEEIPQRSEVRSLAARFSIRHNASARFGRYDNRYRRPTRAGHARSGCSRERGAKSDGERGPNHRSIGGGDTDRGRMRTGECISEGAATVAE